MATLLLAVPLTPMEVVLRLMVELLVGEATVMTGGVSSRFTVTDAVATSPAVSVTVPEMTWPAPSVETI